MLKMKQNELIDGIKRFETLPLKQKSGGGYRI